MNTREQQIVKWKKRPMSWSQISSWGYDKKQWFDKYILDKSEPANAAMLFGNVVGQSFETDTPMVPDIPRQEHMEYELNINMNNIPLIGFIDSWGPKSLILEEYKTSQNANRWDQKSVNEHDQLTMYALMLLLQDNVTPDKIEMRLHYIPVRENGSFEMELVDPQLFHTYSTTRTMNRCLEFGTYIQELRKTMELYAATQA